LIGFLCVLCVTSAHSAFFLHAPREIPYFAVGITNSAPFEIDSGHRCMIDFCFV
jgi:hypothetical protein